MESTHIDFTGSWSPYINVTEQIKRHKRDNNPHG